MVVVGISLGGTPGCGVSIDGGATEVENSHVVEGEGTGRSRSRAVIGRADRPRAGSSDWSRTGSSHTSLLNRARGITVSPGTNSRDVVVVGISLGGTPWCGVSIDGGASRPGASPSNLSISSNLASEAARVLLLVGPELDLQGPRLAGGREDLSNSLFICSIKLFGYPLNPQEIALGNVKGLTPDVNLLSCRHLDLPVALGLVGVVLGEVGRFDGNLLSISEISLSVLAAQSFHLILWEEGLLCRPCICSCNSSEEDEELHPEKPL